MSQRKRKRVEKGSGGGGGRDRLEHRQPQPGDSDSCSTSFTHRGRHVWTIRSAKSMVIERCDKPNEKTDLFIQLGESGTFTVGPEVPAAFAPRHNRWRLEISAQYDKEKKKPHFGVYLHQLFPKWGPVPVHCRMLMGKLLVHDSTNVHENGTGWGASWPVDTIKWETFGYTKETDTIVIEAVVDVPAIETATAEMPGVTAFDLAPSYQALFDNPKHADVTVETADGIRIPAHKLILRARSPFFDLLFDQPMRETIDGTVRVGANETVVRALLSYLYTGRTSGVAQTVVKLPDAVALFETAQLYQLPELAKVAAGTLVKLTSVSNVMGILQTASRHAASGATFSSSNKTEAGAGSDASNNTSGALPTVSVLEQCATVARGLVKMLQNFLRQNQESFIEALPDIASRPSTTTATTTSTDPPTKSTATNGSGSKTATSLEC